MMTRFSLDIQLLISSENQMTVINPKKKRRTELRNQGILERKKRMSGKPLPQSKPVPETGRCGLTIPVKCTSSQKTRTSRPKLSSKSSPKFRADVHEKRMTEKIKFYFSKNFERKLRLANSGSALSLRYLWLSFQPCMSIIQNIRII